MENTPLSGPALSAIVAEQVFGEPQPPMPPSCPKNVVYGSPKGAWIHMHDAERSCEWRPYFFAEYMDSAMLVLAKFPIWNINKTDHPSFAGAPYSVMVGVHDDEHSSKIKAFEVQAASVEVGICRAALKAMNDLKG